MPTSATLSWTGKKLEPYQSPQDVREISVRLGASLNLAMGTVLARKDSDGLYYAYDDTQVDGRGVARGILPYAAQTDVSSNITLSDSVSTGGEHGEKHKSVPMYVAGTFLFDDLTGLDAIGLDDLKGKVISGSGLATGGVVKF